jgi:hypothetical protein
VVVVQMWIYDDSDVTNHHFGNDRAPYLCFEEESGEIVASRREVRAAIPNGYNLVRELIAQYARVEVTGSAKGSSVYTFVNDGFQANVSAMLTLVAIILYLLFQVAELFTKQIPNLCRQLGAHMIAHAWL